MSSAARRVERLIAQVGVLQHPPDGMKPGDVGLTETEREFFEAALRRHDARVWRSGWPDFLVRLPRLGYVGIEIKSGGDTLRSSQRRMFAAVEAAGIKIYIWHPNNPAQLIPWRKFLASQRMTPEEIAEARRLRKPKLARE